MGFEHWNFERWDRQKIDDRIRLESQRRPSLFSRLYAPLLDIRKGVNNAIGHTKRKKETQDRREKKISEKNKKR